jgi:hypothetical protein
MARVDGGRRRYKALISGNKIIVGEIDPTRGKEQQYNFDITV